MIYNMFLGQKNKIESTLATKDRSSSTIKLFLTITN